MKLSILMPVYNEAATVSEVVGRVLAVDFSHEVELIVVDDGSSDGTWELLTSHPRADDPRLRLHRHAKNAGKGAAIRTAAGLATGEYLVPCDADLEYRPEELPMLMQPIINGEAQVVFGVRGFGGQTAYSLWYVLGNKGVTTFANVLHNCYISDLETCFKVLPLDLYRELDIRQGGFGMEAEITGKLLRRGIRPFEVPITYRARTREEGKKITWRDGVEAIGILTRTRFRK